MATNYNYQGLNYDILSIMHYGAYAFSTNGQATITAVAAGTTLLDAYQKTALSSVDITALKSAYSVSTTVSSCYQGTTSTSITPCSTAYRYCYVSYYNHRFKKI